MPNVRRGFRPLFRPLAYLWASPNTLLGLLVVAAALLTGGRARVERGVVEVHGGFARFLLRHLLYIRASALTLGHVVVGQDRDALDFTRDHEHVHVRQYERWGPAFLPAYVLSSVRCWRRGENPYLDNAFEKEAYRIAP